MLLTNWQLYASMQDRHRHQRNFSHYSYHTSHLNHWGQATHRGWSFLKLEQFLPRPFGTHCWTMSSTLATFEKQLKTPPFSQHHVKRMHFLLWGYTSFYHSFIHSVAFYWKALALTVCSYRCSISCERNFSCMPFPC